MRSLVAFMFLTLCLAWVAAPARGAEQNSLSSAAVIVVSGKIDDLERDALMRRFKQARATGAKTVIVEIDTYGGLVTSALDISRFIKRQDDLHTIAFVRDKAISAGAMIAMACDEIVMQPASVIGDCAPIVFKTDGTLDSLPPAERAKAESPVLADFLDSARRNHHDPLLAIAMVSVDHTVHYVQNAAGEKKLVNEADFKALPTGEWKPVADVHDPIVKSDELLTLYSNEATIVGISRGEYASPEALATARDLQIIAIYQPTAGEAFVELLGNPIARLLLIIVFVVSLKLALSIPGHGAPEAVSLLSLGLLLGIPLLTGYAQWWEVLMIFVGLGLVAFEIFVFPGHFVSAIVGVLMIAAGLVMTFVGQEPAGPGSFPNMQMTIAAIERGLLVVTAGLACSLLLWLWLNRFLPKLPYFNRLVLVPPGGDPSLMGALGADLVWPLVGQNGTALSDLKPGGTAAFHEETINDVRPLSVVSDGAYIRAGSDVVVVESRGNRVVVRAANT